MAHQHGTGTNVLLLARRNSKGDDLVESYKQMEGLEVCYQKHPFLCGVILTEDSGWTSEKDGFDTKVKDASGRVWIESHVDHNEEDRSFATVLS